MNNQKIAMTVMTLIGFSNGFVLTPLTSKRITLTGVGSSNGGTLPYFIDILEDKKQPTLEQKKKSAHNNNNNRKIKNTSGLSPNSPRRKQDHNKEGIFTPAVMAAKLILGQDRLNKVRGDAIGLHSKVIASFVSTAESPFGQEVLKQLFEITDSDGNGSIDREELEVALRSLGFDLSEKQISGIFERADKDKSGDITVDEWMGEAPKTLRTNLTKLAKKNGGELGFLS